MLNYFLTYPSGGGSDGASPPSSPYALGFSYLAGFYGVNFYETIYLDSGSETLRYRILPRFFSIQ